MTLLRLKLEVRAAAVPCRVSAFGGFGAIGAVGAIGAICACWTPAARADSAQGADTLLGNSSNPRGLDPGLVPSTEPVGSFRPSGSRSPTGLRYPNPSLDAQRAQAAGSSGWLYNLSAEVGIVAGDGNPANPLGREYRDVHNGLALSWFSLTADKPEAALHLSLAGASIGRRDQFYGLEFGRYNDWRVRAFVDEVPHALGDGSTFFGGTGSARMTLPSTLISGNSSLAALDAAAKAGTPYSFNVQRNRAGVRGDWTLSDPWKVFTGYTYEHREGSRPMGGSMFFPLGLGPGVTAGGITELAEPIEYQTHDITAGVRYASQRLQFNLTANASLFRNANSALTWDNPYNVGSLGPRNPYTANLKLGQMALSPDSQAYNVKAELVRAFPEWAHANLNATVSLGRMTQNEALLPPSVNNGIGGNAPFTWDNANWNTTAALSKQTSGARIDTRLASLQLSAVPADKLTVRGKLRYYETINHTEYTAFNPLTGQYGYLATGGGQGTVVPGESGIYTPGGGTVHYRAIPFDGNQANLGIDADYRLRRSTVLTAAYERENTLRHHRERARTWEDKLKVGVVERAAGDGTLRASYEFADRRGSAYESDPYEAFYTSSLPGAAPNTVPHTLAELRKYDISDRRQHTLNLRYNRPFGDALDAGVTLQAKRLEWGADFGRVDPQTLTSLNFDLGWTPADGASAYAYYSYERGRIDQANVNDSATNTHGSPNYGGDVYLTRNLWRVRSRDRTDVLGLGTKTLLKGALLLDAGYTFTRSNTLVSYDYLDGGGAVLGRPGALLPDVGNAFPNLSYRLHSLQTGLLIPASKTVSWRLSARYETMKIADWHYTGLTPGALPSNTGGLLPATFIDQGPRNYHNLLFGVFLQYRL